MTPQRKPKSNKARSASRPARKDKTKVLLLVGTRKGAFIFHSNRARKKWKMSGPHFAGWNAHHLSLDLRQGPPGILFAALNHDVYGANIHRSLNLGETWQMAHGPSFPEGSGRTVKRVWRVEPGHADRPNEVWAGIDPASLFKSEDSGHKWAPVPGLNDHPTREKQWTPGAGGLILHSILPHPTDPNTLHVAISAAGVFETTDGGETWTPKNRGTRACFMPEGQQWPEVGQCCHHLVRSHVKPNFLFQQNHCGVYRTENSGDQWTDIGEGLPSSFGFAMGIYDTHQAQTIYVVPELGDEYRYTPDGALAVYRSPNGGRRWERLTRGLPSKGAYLNILREGLTTDTCDPGGVYLGTSTGQLFYSRNEGNAWDQLADFLPPIYCVSTAVVEN